MYEMFHMYIDNKCLPTPPFIMYVCMYVCVRESQTPKNKCNPMILRSIYPSARINSQTPIKEPAMYAR